VALDATVAGASANSYLTLEAAAALNAERLGPQAARWSAASETDRIKALISASVYIDAAVRTGLRYISTQRLVFPRAVDVLAGVPFIPLDVQRATFEQALHLLSNAHLMDDNAARRARGMFQFDEQGGPSGTLAIDGAIGLLSPMAQFFLKRVVPLTGSGSGRVSSVRIHSRYSRPRAGTLT
jgi:hypothetical protein